MFPTPALAPRNVLNPSEYRFGPHCFKVDADRMDALSTASFASDTTIKPCSSNGSINRAKKRATSTQPVRSHSSYMTAGLKRHFNSSQYSDLIVRCRDDEYHVHRIIMCSQSQWFAKVCATASSVLCLLQTNSYVLDTDVCKETAIQTVDLSADDPDAVDAMLQYCYQLDYADKFLGLSSAGYTIYSLNPHIDIYLLAARYGVPGLKHLAVEKFEKRAAVLSRVETNKDKFFQAIRIIYASTRPGHDDLRNVAVRLCADHAEQYILQGGKTATRVFKLMDEIPAFRVDFIKELASRLR